MAGTGKKWLAGCGIGCGAMILLAVLGGTLGFKALREVEKEIDGINESMIALEDQYGDRFAYVPEIDGSVPSDRMEAFLATRESVLARSQELSSILEQIEDDDLGWFKKMMLWKNVVPVMITFGSERTEAMLEQGIGIGEYEYIYALAFFNVLANDPSDGPSFMMNDSDDESEGRIQFSVSTDEGEIVREERSERVRNFFNKGQRAVLENQVTAYRATLSADADWTDEEWGAALLAEKNALKLESVRMLWEDDMPDHIRNSFTPYLDRLAATYFPLINPIELELSDD
ncbi:MAG: hypothetical protein ACI9UK_002580 [Candidatus Krumholzibacteriia bacterium]|jgi:hypothetical protein